MEWRFFYYKYQYSLSESWPGSTHLALSDLAIFPRLSKERYKCFFFYKKAVKTEGENVQLCGTTPACNCTYRRESMLIQLE